MPKLSVIMPAYNAARYISASIDSVLSQTLRELELIVVNDGSKDATAELVSAAAETDSRVRLITVENGGPARARNIALDAVSPDSEYIMFIDADDLLRPDAAELALASGPADLCLLGFNILEVDGGVRKYCEPDELIDISRMKDCFSRLYTANLLNQVWAKLFRAGIIREHSIRFPDWRWGEDRLFVFEYMRHCKTVAVLEECLYSYVMHEGESLITRFYAPKAEVSVLIDEKIRELCAEYGVEDESGFRYMFAKSIFSCFTTLFSASCSLSRREKRAYVRSVLAYPEIKERCTGCAGGFPVRFLTAVLRSGLPGLNLFVFHHVAAAGKLAPKLFMKLKHRK